MYRAAIPALLILSLAACGTSDGDDSGGGAVLVNRDLVSYTREAQRLSREYDNARITDTANLPDDRVRYDGIAVGAAQPDTNNEEVLVGRASIVADFDDNTLSGRLSDFVDEAGDDYDGSIDVSDGRINGARFDANLDGTIGSGNDEETVVGILDEGEFVGDNAEGLVAVGGGQLIGDNGTRGFEVGVIAER